MCLGVTLKRRLGANWRVFQGIHKMNGWIVVRILASCAAKDDLLLIQDFDGGTIGSSVTQAYLNVTGPKEQISWYSVPTSQFPNGESDIPDEIINERAWVAIVSEYFPGKSFLHDTERSVVNAGASDRLSSAINNGSDSGYNNSAAVTIYSVEARNENA